MLFSSVPSLGAELQYICADYVKSGQPVKHVESSEHALCNLEYSLHMQNWVKVSWQIRTCKENSGEQSFAAREKYKMLSREAELEIYQT